ncbi:MAG TPA: hypothetical protein VK892_13610 [Pyrinomonadaceae bacterium]|nr:hypothetical protein [Pyrinomonadaceae bacterium]
MNDSKDKIEEDELSEKFYDALSDFLLEDYKQKIAYLTAHLGRMWTRFNFFLTAEVALLAYLFTTSRELTPITLEVAVIELIISVIWWEFGRQDRFLVLIYREQIKDTTERLLKAELRKKGEDDKKYSDLVDNYRYTGETEKTADDLEKNAGLWNRITQNRGKHLSITRLAAFVPFLAMVLWLLMVLYFLIPKVRSYYNS